MTYSIFHILKRYQENVPCQLEHVTWNELENFIEKSGKEENNHDLLCSYYCNHVDNGNQ